MSVQAIAQTQTAKPTFTPISHGLLQRAAVDSSHIDEVPPMVHEVLRSPGRPLDTQTRAFMEPRFGHDFSGVRVHTDVKAAESARAVNALAYTVGGDIVFGDGRYSPGMLTGKQLIAHELTHVLQQSHSAEAIKQLKRMDGGAENRFEKEADIQAEHITHSQDGMATTVQRQLDRPILQRQAEDRATSAQRRPYPRVKVWINSFIPHERVEGPPFHDCFAGDNRGFSSDPNASSRTHQLIELVGASNVSADIRRIGTTHEVECDTGQVTGTGRASEDELSNTVAGGRTSADATVAFQADASNPLVSAAPAINLEAEFRLDMVSRQCTFNIDHDGFPGYEAYLKPSDGPVITVYTYDPRAEGEGISALFPPMDWTGTRRFSF
jgi:hypothetical protein